VHCQEGVAEVSLTSQLHHGVLGDWCAASLLGTAVLVDQVQAAVVGRWPVRPVGKVDGEHWARIGGAFGQRFAFVVDHGPPWPAYAGTANAGLLGGQMLHTVVTRWPGVPDLGADPLDNELGTSDALICSFTDQLVEHLGEHAPPGTIAGTRRAEETLARACWVLSGWEDAYRGGALPPAIARAHQELSPAPDDVEAARAAVNVLLLHTPVHVTEELVALVGRLHGSGALDQLRALAGNPPPGAPLGVTQPVFVPHWADGDVIVGNTLLDCKTVITVRDRNRITGWLHQLLGYAWLDSTADRYGIRSVGLLLTWPLEYFEQILLQIPGRVPAARREFLDYAYAAIELEGAEPFDELDQRTHIA
jgi:hypothetical protein